ncbi:autotransporter domain-containing protein [Amphritea sp. HPY]|uniref:autotransporter domain-containing protein n=1 Tax=Amphritea sp. HPY TaxID=3421652 RepID=UPI003D7E8F0C
MNRLRKTIFSLLNLEMPSINHMLSVFLFLTILLSTTASSAVISCSGTETISSDSAVRYDDSAGTCTISDDTTPLTGLDDITFVVKPDPNATYDYPADDATEEVYFGTGSGSNQTLHTGCTLGVSVISAGSTCKKPSFHVNATFNNTVNRTDSSGNSVVMNVNVTTSSGAGVANNFSINTATITIDTAPNIISITRQAPSTSPTNADIVTWRVTFDEGVKNVDSTDFSVLGTTAVVSSVSTVSSSVYDVTVSGGNLANLNSTVTLGFSGSQNIQDLASIALFSTTPTGSNDNTFVIQNDLASPSVDILNAPSSITNRDSFNVTFEFSEDVTGFAVGDISVGNGAASNFVADDGNSYIADITPNGAGNVTIDVSSGVATDAASNPNTAATQVSVTCGAGCGESATIAKTQQVIRNFTANKIRHMTVQGPGISGFLDSDGMGGSINGYFETPIDLQLNNVSQSNSGQFSTSFQQLSSVSQNNNAASQPPMSHNQYKPPINIWIKGRWSKINDNRGGLDDEIDFGIIYLGTDYRLSEDLLIGFMGQYDWFNQSEVNLGYQAEGTGWMFGPYMVKRLKDKLTLDFRLAWGQAENKVNPIGSYWDEYDSERWQVEGNLTGSYTFDKWHVAPTLGLNYFIETQEEYIDSNAFTIPEDSVELGTLTFGPKITYLAESSDGNVIRPYVTAKGVWDFTAPDIYDVNGIASGTEKLRAKVGFGLNLVMENGTSLNVGYTYDGIGLDDYEAHTSELSASVSLDDTGMPEGSTLSTSYSVKNSMLLTKESLQYSEVKLDIPF